MPFTSGLKGGSGRRDKRRKIKGAKLLINAVTGQMATANSWVSQANPLAYPGRAGKIVRVALPYGFRSGPPNSIGRRMAITISLASNHPARSVGLEVWMDRVLDRADRCRHGWDADDVHDLRVALRRCRTMADALSEVNPGPGWRKLKRASRELFHALGESPRYAGEACQRQEARLAGRPFAQTHVAALVPAGKEGPGDRRAGARRVRSQGMAEADAQADFQVALLPGGKRRFSAAGACEAE